MSSEAVAGLSSGLRAMQSEDWMRSEKYAEQLRRVDRVAVHEKLLLFEKVFITRLQKLHVPMFVHCFWRNADDQLQAYLRGNSRARYGESPHNFGLAMDLIHGVKAWDLPEQSWRLIGHIGKEVAAQNGVKIVWGGDFKSLWDPAHWELKDWRSIAKPL